MSYQGDETIIIGTLPSDVETGPYARKLLRRHGKNDLGKNIAFDYEFDGASFDLTALLCLAPLPWRSSSGEADIEVIDPDAVAAAREACASVTTDLDEFASEIISAVAQVFAAVIRTLRRAAKQGRGIILVHEIRGLE